jgi:hypothetical protein
MASPYRPEQASGMTGSSVAHGLAGGVHLPQAVSGFDVHFQKPQEGHPMFNAKQTSFPAPTHSYEGGMQGRHVVHKARI